MEFCSLFSGSSGNALLVTTGKTTILIDAGVSASRIVGAMAEAGIPGSMLTAVIVTHEHRDHVSGVDVLTRKFQIPFYGTEPTLESMRRKRMLKDDHFSRSCTSGVEFVIGELAITPFTIPHDAAGPVGYRITDGRVTIAIATDLGHMNDELFANFEGCSLVLLESNHDVEMLTTGMYPQDLKDRILGSHGHLSNDAAAETVVRLASGGTKKIVLGHLSKENNTPRIAFDTVTAELARNGITVGSDVALSVAPRDSIGRRMMIG
jgi:phosphoribosyl 1,2-cyclic phosphodiesterase